jgi:hypothetical protein
MQYNGVQFENYLLSTPKREFLSTKEETARLLLGRKVNLVFRVSTTDPPHPLEPNGTVIGVHYQLQNEYSLHIKFDALLDQGIIDGIAESAA